MHTGMSNVSQDCFCIYIYQVMLHGRLDIEILLKCILEHSLMVYEPLLRVLLMLFCTDSHIALAALPIVVLSFSF